MDCVYARRFLCTNQDRCRVNDPEPFQDLNGRTCLIKSRCILVSHGCDPDKTFIDKTKVMAASWPTSAETCAIFSSYRELLVRRP